MPDTISKNKTKLFKKISKMIHDYQDNMVATTYAQAGDSKTAKKFIH